MGGNIKIPSIGERQSLVKYVLPVVLLCIAKDDVIKEPFRNVDW